MPLLDESHLLDLTDNLSKYLLYHYSKVLKQFRVTSGNISLNTVIKLPWFKSRLVFIGDTVSIMISEACLEAWRNTCPGYCSYTALIPTMARDNVGENIYPLTFPFLFFVSTNPSLCVLFWKFACTETELISHNLFYFFQTLIIPTRAHQFYCNFKPVTTVTATASRHSQKYVFVMISLTYLTGNIDRSLITQILWAITLIMKKNNTIRYKSVF